VIDSEHWLEVNLKAKVRDQDGILLDVLAPYVDRLKETGKLVGFHYFREPEIRFRIRLRSEKDRRNEKVAIEAIAQSLKRKGLVSEWHFGNHGDASEEYRGEEDRYGKNGWKVAQEYFQNGAETALKLLELKRRSKLENPLWAKGLGNPWEGGEDNPWKEREEDPLVYQWSRYVHLFTNQLGFDIDDEARLCAKQSERYAKIWAMGIEW
jgi:hypothetical protein